MDAKMGDFGEVVEIITVVHVTRSEESERKIRSKQLGDGWSRRMRSVLFSNVKSVYFLTV